jgi:hypothetical protein
MTTKHPDLLHPSTRATLDRLTRTENEIDDLLEGEPSDETTSRLDRLYELRSELEQRLTKKSINPADYQ